ncbi:hypothetical protein QTN25_003988 [Entamoeba marina]
MPVKINVTLILRGFFAFTGLFIFLTGLIHLCKSGWSGWSVKGIESNASVVCGFIAILLMVEGIYVLVSPWVFLIPTVKDYVNIWSINTSLAWMLITGIITLFFSGWFGLITSILCFICAIFCIVLSVLSCVTKKQEDDEEERNDPYNP